MIPDDDPRHGTVAGYVARCRKQCCRDAAADYERHRKTRHYIERGPLRIDPIPTKRRIRALMALGWSASQLDAKLGKKRTYTIAVLASNSVLRSTAKDYAALYDRLSMTLPPQNTRWERMTTTRNRNYARAQGWPPPLAYTDIDDPNDQPTGWEYEERKRGNGTAPAEPIDPVTVERILGGEWHLPATPAERTEVARAWTESGGSVHFLAQLTGWKVERYLKTGEAA